MPSVRWANGKVDTADSWQDLLDTLRAAQWAKYDEIKFREVMKRRAIVWSGSKINIDGNAEQFIRELEYARLLVIVDDTTTETADKNLLN